MKTMLFTFIIKHAMEYKQTYVELNKLLVVPTHIQWIKEWKQFNITVSNCKHIYFISYYNEQ
jgi:hypothetical protein